MEAIDYFEILADYNSLSADEQKELKQVYDLINEPDRTWTPIIQQGDASYEGCADLLIALEEIGWTFDYGLDGQPIELQPL